MDLPLFQGNQAWYLNDMAFDNKISKILEDARRGKELDDAKKREREIEDLGNIVSTLSDNFSNNLSEAILPLVTQAKLNKQEIKEAFQEAFHDQLSVKMDVNPDITIPPFPTPKVTVKVPKSSNKVLVDEMRKVKDAINAKPIPIFEKYPEYTFKQPIPAILVDPKGKPMDISGGQRMLSLTRFMDSDNNPVAVSATNPLPTTATLSVTSAIDVTQVSGASWSTYITGAAASTYAEIMNPDGRVKVELPTGSSGLTDTELRASGLEVKQVSGFTDSVFVTGFADSMTVYQARTTNPTAKSDGADVRPSADKLGRGINTPIQVRQLRATAYATLSTNAETTLLSGASGVFHDLIWVKFANTSSGAVTIDLRDGTAGSIVDTYEVPANSISGVAMPAPWPQSEAAAAWTVDYNDSDLSNTTVYVSGLFTKEL